MQATCFEVPLAIPPGTFIRQPVVYIAESVWSDRPLYIGVTRRFVSRLGQHRGRSRWWSSMDYVEVLYDLPSLDVALDLEAHLIRERRPEFNTVGVPR